MLKLNWTSRLRILDYFFTSKVRTYQQWMGSKFGKMSLVSFTPFLTDARGRIFSAGYNNERSTSHWLYSFRCTETSSGSFSRCFLTFSFVPSLQVSFPILWVFLSHLRALKSDLHSLQGIREAKNGLALSRDVTAILALIWRPPFSLFLKHLYVDF